MVRILLMVALAVAAASASSPKINAAAAPGRVNLARLPDGAIQPQIVTDAKGTAHVVYFKGDPAHGDAFYATLDAAGRFSSPLRINRQPGAVIATGTMRGAHLALGRNGRVHVAWHGSAQAQPRPSDDGTPVLYSRLSPDGRQFEPERNVVQRGFSVDGGSVAADASGHVYVAWHAQLPEGGKGEADRRVWVVTSIDDGRTWSAPRAASDPATGACGCCGVGALADRRGTLYLTFRAAIETVHRGAYLLTSRDHGSTFGSAMLQDWNIGACPMSTFSFAQGPDAVLAAWETAGQVQWTRIDPQAGRSSTIVAAPGVATNRKHPSIATNARGETLLVWAEDTGWNKGGSFAWQLFDERGQPAPERGRQAGIPVWGLAAAAARADGGFTIVY